MNNQEILDNAPEGATHVDADLTYIRTEPCGRFLAYFTFQDGEWVEDDEFNILLTRSLADIKRIAELEKELEGYKQIAKERAEFIINGEELGYISLPESQTDRAYLTFMMCKLTDEYAAMEALKEKG